MAFERFKNAWNAFRGRNPTINNASFYASSRPDRSRYRGNNLQKIVGPIYNRIAVDSSMINLNHVRLDENGRYLETISSRLNRALTVEANVDQTGRELIREAVLRMLFDGNVAIVPVYTTVDPYKTESYDIYDLRVAKIKRWESFEVVVEIYNETTGKIEELSMSKRHIAIIENPFYEIMNAPTSTGQRLIQTLNQLGRMNEDHSSGKLDLIIQLPYQIKSEARKRQAEERRKDIEEQLSGSKYGVAYTDGTERIVQLNRSLENNLWNQVKELEQQLYDQLGVTKAVFDGTADEKTLLNYINQTIEPILTAISEEMERKWISRTAQTQGQAIRFFEDPFRLVPVAQLAEMVDKLTRNEVMTSNEIRSILRMKPAKDPRADELRNANLNHPEEKSVDNPDTDEQQEFQNQ